jgi:hypothetical protein
MNSDPRWLPRAEALYALALRVYPQAFRAQWGDAMRQAFRDRCREVARGQRTALGLASELLPDLAFAGGRERFQQLGHDMSKRNLLLAGLLVLFVATLLSRDLVSATAQHAGHWWQQRSERRAEAASRAYWSGLAQALEGKARVPRDHSVLGIAWGAAGAPGRYLAADPDAQARGQAHWDEAVASGDLPALWLSIGDCPVVRCDRDAAVAKLRQQAPGNAAAHLAALPLAQDLAARDRVMADIAASSYFHGYNGDLLKSLLRSDLGVDGDGVAQVAGRWMAWAIPGGFTELSTCRPGRAGPTRDAQCLAAARLLADGDSLIARAIGLRIWHRYAHDGPEGGEVRKRLRALQWTLRNVPKDDADLAGSRTAWLAADGEYDALQRMMAARGIATTPPADFRLPPEVLDPMR